MPRSSRPGCDWRRNLRQARGVASATRLCLNRVADAPPLAMIGPLTRLRSPFSLLRLGGILKESPGRSDFMTKEDVAAALVEYGQLLELKGEPSFRTLSYSTAARALLDYPGDFSALVAAGRVTEIHGIGSTLKAKIETLMATGRLPQLDALRAEVPPGLIQMLRIPGLGTKKVKALFDNLKVTTLAGLKAAGEDGRVAKLKGFGAKTQAKILDGLRFVMEAGRRVRIDQALAIVTTLAERLREVPGVIGLAATGSVRRRKETVGNVGLLVSAADSSGVLDAFTSQSEVIRVVSRTENSADVVLGLAAEGATREVNADVRVVTDEQFPVTLVQYTGSAGHVEKLRTRAVSRGLQLTESELLKGKKVISCASEEDVYSELGLAYVPPELREDVGEIE